MRAALAVVAITALLLAPGETAPQRASIATPAFDVTEASITDLQRALQDGRVTSRVLTAQYLARIARYNDRLKAAISVNSAALAEADARDRERRERGRRPGPLHGIPIALKDNIQTLTLPTTGGALAFRNLIAPYEATIARHLRDAGAIVIAKTTLTELANWVADDMPTGYNAILGYSANPYQLLWTRRGDVDVPARLPGGSSSGIGTAASLWAASVGSETSGSILNPSHETLLVGVKPTVGRLSRYGMIPITLDQDTPGPMARNVTDAAILLGALEGTTADPNDAATGACAPPAGRDYRQGLRTDALRGARLGIPRALFYERRSAIGIGGGLLTAAQERLMADALAALRRAGATIVDPVSLPSTTASDADRNLLQFPICFGSGAPGRCSTVLRYGMKRDFNRWLTSLGPRAPVKSLTELRAWNVAHRAEGSMRFGQAQLDASDAVDLERDRRRYLDDLARDRRLSRTEGLDAALTSQRLDALIFPAYFGASVAARAGYPSVIVPFIDRPAASATDAAPTPFSVTFTGGACSEPRLLALAYAFEQATRRRIPPTLP